MKPRRIVPLTNIGNIFVFLLFAKVFDGYVKNCIIAEPLFSCKINYLKNNP